MVVPIAMDWRHLCFANWPIDVADLRPSVPAPLSIDTARGTAWLSIVPFVNVDLRPAGLPRALGVDLPEINLRTYVTYDGVPGVYFLSLDADGLLPVLGARLVHHLPYYLATIDLAIHHATATFESRRRHPGARPAAFRATYRPAGEPFEAAPGSLAWFLTSRFRYYTEGTDGGLRYADVRHEPWQLFPAEVHIAENTIFAGNSLPDPAGKPTMLYSPGVTTVASTSKRVPTS